MIDYFYSIKIIKSESASEFSDLRKLETDTYDMSSIIKHEIPVKTYKETRFRKETIVGTFHPFLFYLFDVIVGIFVLVMGIFFLITSGGDQDYSQLGLFLIILSAALFSLLILGTRHRFKSIAKSIARYKKAADDRGITTEEVKKCYTIVRESDWVKFKKIISKKINDEIQKFKQLLDDGVISQEEFEKKKKEISTPD
jgi:ABC-type multidrug transport system fused ATPase/permease subunit